MITSIDKLFVKVPVGSGATFVKSYAKSDKYTDKICFVQEFGEIWLNGTAYGISQADDVAKLKEEIQSLATTVDASIAQEVKDRDDAIAAAGEKLKNEILGDDIQPAFDTLKEIANWIEKHGSDASTFFNEVNNIADEKIPALKKNITSLCDRAKALEETVDSSLTPAIDDNKATLVDASTRIGANEAAIAVIDASIAAMETTDSSIADRVSTLENAIDSSLTPAIDKHTSDILAINGNINTLDTSVNANEVAIATIDSSVNALETAVEINTTNIANLTARVKKEEETARNAEKTNADSIEALTERVSAVENLSVWLDFSFDSDAPVITDETILGSSAAKIAEAATTDVSTKDVVVLNSSALDYFTSSSAKTFKNITI